MEEQTFTNRLSEMGIDLLNWTQDSAIKFVQLLQEEIPELIESFLLYRLIVDVVDISVCVIFIAVCIYAIKIGFKLYKSYDGLSYKGEEYAIGGIILIALSSIIILISSWVFVHNAKEVGLNVFAPKMFLVREVMDYTTCVKKSLGECSLFED